MVYLSGKHRQMTLPCISGECREALFIRLAMENEYEDYHHPNELNGVFEDTVVSVTTRLKTSELPFISSGELLELANKEIPYIIDSIVPEAGMCALSGTPASGKTWIMLLMGLAVSKGEVLLERFSTRQTNVGVIDEESGQIRLAIRMQKLNLDDSYPIKYLSKFGVKVTDKRTHKNIIDFCKAHDIKLLFFDSLVRIHSAKENDATEMNKVYEALKGFTQEGIAVVFLHHHTKRIGDKGTTSLRGSGDVLAWVDVHISIDKAEDIHTISQPKARDFEEFKSFKVRRIQNEDGSISFLNLGEIETKKSKREETRASIISLLSDPEHPELNQSSIIKMAKERGVSVGEKAIAKVLDDMARDGHITTRQGSGHSILYSINANLEYELGFEYEEDLG